MAAARNTSKTSKAAAARKAPAASKPRATKAAVAPDTTQHEAERVAERCANAKRALDAAPGWVDVIARATEELDDDAARAAADELIATARAVRRA